MVSIDLLSFAAFISVVSFLLGRLFSEGRAARQTSQLAFGAALWAITEAKGLKNATVIRSIIEKYNFLEKKGEDLSVDAKKMDEALTAAIEEQKEVRNNRIKIQKDLDPEDLV